MRSRTHSGPGLSAMPQASAARANRTCKGRRIAAEVISRRQSKMLVGRARLCRATGIRAADRVRKIALTTCQIAAPRRRFYAPLWPMPHVG